MVYCTYLLRDVLYKYANCLDIFLLIRVLHHDLHVLLHFLKVRLRCEYSDEQ